MSPAAIVLILEYGLKYGPAAYMAARFHIRAMS